MAPNKILVDDVEIKNNFKYSQGSEVVDFFESKGFNDIKNLRLILLENEISGIVNSNSGNTARYKLIGNFSYTEDSITSASVKRIGMTSGGEDYFYGNILEAPITIDVSIPDQSWAWIFAINNLISNGNEIASYDSYEDVKNETGAGLAGLLSYFKIDQFDEFNPSTINRPTPTAIESPQAGPENEKTSETEIGRLYTAAFGRSPDQSGINYWTQMANDGLINYKGMADEFIRSEEFTARFGENIPSDQFVSNLYQNILGRTPELAGWQFWVDQLSNGLAKNELLIEFANSNENIQLYDSLA